MIIGIAGAAGSGKDTTAALIGKYVDIVNIAQAAPMKRFAGKVFGFTQDQLFGPSESRNAPDERFTEATAWDEARAKLREHGVLWIREVLPGLDLDGETGAWEALKSWFDDVVRAHTLYIQRMHAAMPDPLIRHKPLTPRYVLQTIGTEWGRQFSPDMWNDCAISVANKLLAGGYSYTNEGGIVEDRTQTGPEFVGVTDVRFRNELLGIKRQGGIVINITSPAEDNAAVEKAGVAGHKSEAELKGVPRHWYRYQLVNDKRLGLLALENKVHGLVRKLVANEVL